MLHPKTRFLENQKNQTTNLATMLNVYVPEWIKHWPFKLKTGVQFPLLFLSPRKRLFKKADLPFCPLQKALRKLVN
jgi:hypothetical protein